MIKQVVSIAAAMIIAGCIEQSNGGVVVISDGEDTTSSNAAETESQGTNTPTRTSEESLITAENTSTPSSIPEDYVEPPESFHVSNNLYVIHDEHKGIGKKEKISGIRSIQGSIVTAVKFSLPHDSSIDQIDFSGSMDLSGTGSVTAIGYNIYEIENNYPAENPITSGQFTPIYQPTHDIYGDYNYELVAPIVLPAGDYAISLFSFPGSRYIFHWYLDTTDPLDTEENFYWNLRYQFWERTGNNPSLRLSGSCISAC